MSYLPVSLPNHPWTLTPPNVASSQIRLEAKTVIQSLGDESFLDYLHKQSEILCRKN